MTRFFTSITCAASMLLVGCLRTAEPPQIPVQTLVPIYQEDYPYAFDYLEYSSSGQTLVATGVHFANLYNATNYKKLVEGRAEKLNDSGKTSLFFGGAGHIDDNTWYFVSGVPGERVTAYIKQIEPPRELIKYDIGHPSKLPVVANKHHLADTNTLLDWRSGKQYRVETRVGEFGYTLTENSRVMTHNPIISNTVLIHDPVKQEALSLDTGARVWGATLSADAKYALTHSKKGWCTVWQVLEKKKIGSCGQATIIDPKQTFRPGGRSFRVLIEGEFREYETHSLKVLRSIPLKEKMPASIVNRAMNDKWLAVFDREGYLRVWSLLDGRLRGEYKYPSMGDHHIKENSLAFQPNGDRLAVSQGRLLKVFDLSNPPATPAAPQEQGAWGSNSAR